MRLLAVQLDIAWEDKAANHARICSLIEARHPKPGDFLLLPELGDTGFSMDLDRIVDETSSAFAADLARRFSCFVQHGYADRGPDGWGRNVMALFNPTGEPLGFYHKVHPFSYGHESRHYRGGSRLMLRSCGGATVCPLICYDLRFPELWRHAVLGGAEVFTLGANWPAARQSHWRSLLMARAIENQAFVVGVNRTGDDPHLSYAGGSMVISPKGEILAEADNHECVLDVSLELDRLRHWRAEFPAIRDIRRDLLGSIETDVSNQSPTH